MAKDPRFAVQIGDDPAGAPRPDGDRFSFVIAADFSGRAHRAAASAAPSAAPRTAVVDRDEIDATIAAFAPRLELAIEPGAAPIVITFASLDDFHPDRIAERVATFVQLRALRQEASTPAKRPEPRETNPDRGNAAALQLGSGSLLDQIVGGEPSPASGNMQPADALGDFVARSARGHTVPAISRDQETLIAQIDGVIEATMRVVLHHPAFQALEAAWRGVDFLVRRIDGADPRVALVDVTRDELVSFVETTKGAWSCIVAPVSFGTADVALLERLATAASRRGIPLIAGADATFAGAASFGEGDADDWSDAPIPGWDALRSQPAARFISLAMPRFVLRLPYGKQTDECDTFAFEEMTEPDHDSYLWGSGAFAVAAIVAEGVAAGEEITTQGQIDHLPLHVMRVGGEPTAKPAGETWLVQRAVVRLLDRGLTPLETSRDGDSIRLSRIQSIAMPPKPLPFAHS
jgi:type VI secretion system protein ImpC